MDDKQTKESQSADSDASIESRRNFLKNSQYAVYATPLMTSLIIHSNAAHASGCGNDPDCTPSQNSTSTFK